MQYFVLTDKILSVIIITCQSRKVNSFSFDIFAFNEIFHIVGVTALAAAGSDLHA